MPELNHLRSRVAELELSASTQRPIQEALRASENRYRRLFESARDGIFILDADTGAITAVNPFLTHLLGYSEQELLGQKLWEIGPFKDKKASEIAFHELQTHEYIRYDDLPLETKDGRMIAVEFVSNVYVEDRKKVIQCNVRDVTERKQIDKALRTSAEEFRSLAEAMPQIVWITRPDGWNVYFNQQWMDYTGLTLEESLGHGWNTPFHPEDQQRAWDAWQRATTTASIYSIESRLRRADGVYRWWLVRGVPVKDASGHILKWFGTCTDIHDLKVADLARAQHEEELEESQRIARIGSWEWTPATGVIRWSEGMNHLLARDRGVAAPTFEALEQFYTPESWQRLGAGIALTLKTGASYDLVLEMIRPDGATCWTTTRGEVVHGADGAVVKLRGTVHDITERRRVEESLRLQSAALHAAADAIVITDHTGTIEWINPGFTQLSGYTSDEAVGKHHRDLVNSGKQDKAFFKDLWDTILAGRTWRGEVINRRKDGRLYTQDQSITPITDASGVLTHFIAIQQDITERLQLEAQFRQAQKMESVGQLTSGIAHDFNNLLTVINGMSDLVLQQISKDDPLRADVDEIRRAGERAAALTRQLLAFSRQQILEPRVLSVGTVVAGMETLLGRLLGEDIDLVVVSTSDSWHVRADAGQLEQVITNLAVNARDAMPSGGNLTIEVQNATIDEASVHQHGEAVPPGRYVRLTLSDSGAGMDKATRERIFEPFFTTKGPGKGTGLGLSTAFGIVKQSQGFIGVYSEVGHGTSFRIYLPAVTAIAGTNEPVPPVTPSVCTETILVVEDNAGLRALAGRVLIPAGYDVLVAATGEEALRLLAHYEATVHLLLSDVALPGMSGRLLAEELAQVRPGMKVLYMSGYTSDTIVRHGVLEARMSFLDKPFTAAALLRKVRDRLDASV